MVMGKLMPGSPPRNDAGNVPVAVPTNVPCSELLLQGPFPADPTRGRCFSNATASSAEGVSICSSYSYFSIGHRHAESCTDAGTADHSSLAHRRILAVD